MQTNDLSVFQRNTFFDTTRSIDTSAKSFSKENPAGIYSELFHFTKKSKSVLLQEINQGLSNNVWETYNSLINKKNLFDLSTEEHKQLIEITQKVDTTNNHRLNLIIQLADLLESDIEDLIEGFQTPSLAVHQIYFKSEFIENIIGDSKGLCEYCQNQVAFSFSPFSIELLNRRINFGKPTIENMIYICQSCSNYRNFSANGFDTISGKNSTLFNPRTDEWSKHFTWSDDFNFLIGLTSKGRTTIEKMQLNRETLIKYRCILISINKHPLFLF